MGYGDIFDAVTSYRDAAFPFPCVMCEKPHRVEQEGEVCGECQEWLDERETAQYITASNTVCGGCGKIVDKADGGNYVGTEFHCKECL